MSNDQDNSGPATGLLQEPVAPAQPPKNRGGAPKGSRNAAKAEMALLKRALLRLGTRAIDNRTRLGKTLTVWKADLIADLGGEENLSKQEMLLVEHVSRLHLILESVDGWLFARRGGMINRSKLSLLPVVVQRAALVSSLQGLLRDLGLKRRAKAVPDLRDYIESKKASPTSDWSTAPVERGKDRDPANDAPAVTDAVGSDPQSRTATAPAGEGGAGVSQGGPEETNGGSQHHQAIIGEGVANALEAEMPLDPGEGINRDLSEQ